MSELAVILITLGALFLMGLLTDYLGRHTPLPRVTFLLIFGFLIGPSALDLCPSVSKAWFPIVTNMALVMVGFLLGEKLTVKAFREHGKIVLFVSLAVVVATVVVVLFGLLVIGVPLAVALILAGVAPATDPAATTDVVNESKAKGKFSETLLGVVAVDDAWGLVAFSIMLSLAEMFGGGRAAGPAGLADGLLFAAWDIGGAVLLGLVLGAPMAFLTGRIKPGEPTLAEALGLVFLCGGIAVWLHVSFLLAAMVMGAVVANLARHHNRPFHAIEDIEWPFMILFFILAGASLNLEALLKIGLIGGGYVVLRVIGRLIGGWAGTAMGRADASMRRWMGWAMMPQAGVALGMSLIAVQRLPHLKDVILPVVVGATVIFEVVGPALTRLALFRVGEAGKADGNETERN